MYTRFSAQAYHGTTNSVSTSTNQYYLVLGDSNSSLMLLVFRKSLNTYVSGLRTAAQGRNLQPTTPPG